VFGAPAVMTGPGGIPTNGSFNVTGSVTAAGCTKSFTLEGQFNGSFWQGSFRATFDGCGSCSWPTWNNIIGTPE
jgi:hypothetical protein